jgi:hypothetical protein
MPNNTLLPIMQKWAEAYASGARITYADNQFHYHAAQTPYARVQASGSVFGVLPALTPIEPPAAILALVAEQRTALIGFLAQDWPKAVARYAYQLFYDDYEMVPIAIEAARLGHRVGSVGTAYGRLPVYHGAFEVGMQLPKLPQLPPILAGYGGLEVAKASEPLPPAKMRVHQPLPNLVAIVGEESRVVRDTTAGWLHRYGAGPSADRAGTVNPLTGQTVTIEALGAQRLLRVTSNMFPNHHFYAGEGVALARWDGGSAPLRADMKGIQLLGEYGMAGGLSATWVSVKAYRVTNISTIGGVYVE